MVILILFTMLLFSVDSWAWAPATHLYFAKEVLHFGNLFLPSPLFQLLKAHTSDFLYGCIAADITLGKKFIEWIYNCHNFDVGISLLDHTKNDAERAFVYGYLSHLAADTVSHNYFVPYQNLKHIDKHPFRHAYWEVRLDDYFGDRIWGEIETVIKNPHNHSHDKLLDTALKDTLFSFRTNKALFSSMMAIQRLKKWRQFVRKVNRLSSIQFNESELNEYNLLAVSAIFRLLTDQKQSVVYKVDPTGSRALSEAKKLRKDMKKLAKQKELSPSLHESQYLEFRDSIKNFYFKDYPIQDKNFKPHIHLEL